MKANMHIRLVFTLPVLLLVSASRKHRQKWGSLLGDSRNPVKTKFDCKAEAAIWHLAWSQMKKKFCCEHQGYPCEVMIFDGSDSNATMAISRQAESLYSGEAIPYSFTDKHLHKEYVAETACDEPVFVKKGNGKMCSVGLFTAERLSCTPLPREGTESWLKSLSGLAPKTDRGFSFEFEFVARTIPQSLLRETYEALMSSRRYRRDSIIKFLKTPAGHVQCLHICAEDVTNGISSEMMAALKLWNWETDSSVHPLSPEEAASINAHEGETEGTPFEVTAPGPPNVLSGQNGFESTLHMLAVLKHMGIQAGPSQGTHVHVNVMSDEAPGALLTTRKVAHVWAAYAKYQLVIDEFFSPSRPGNAYANRLFMGNCEPIVGRGKCSNNPCGCNRRFFNQMHDALSTERKNRIKFTALEFCNLVLALPGSPQPCKEKYPHQRYFQLNLVPLHKFGTIEFRAHSATYDPERLFRFSQFLLAFVEYFGTGAGSAEMDHFFSASSPDEDYEKLAKAQRNATARELFQKLGQTVDSGSARFFAQRTWEKDDATCNPTSAKATTHLPECGGSPEDLLYGDGATLADLLGGFGPLFGGAGGFSFAELQSQADGEHTMRVKMPKGVTPGSYLNVMMPEGYVRAEKVGQDAIKRGYHEFTYNPSGSDSLLEEETPSA